MALQAIEKMLEDLNGADELLSFPKLKKQLGRNRLDAALRQDFMLHLETIKERLVYNAFLEERLGTKSLLWQCFSITNNFQITERF